MSVYKKFVNISNILDFGWSDECINGGINFTMIFVFCVRVHDKNS